MRPRLAAVAMLMSFAADARAIERSFQVGAVVAPSATVSAASIAGSGRVFIQVRTAHRAPPAALLVNGQPRLLSATPRVSVVAPAGVDTVVTILY